MRLEQAQPRIDRKEWRRGWPLVVAGMVGIGTGPGLYQNISSLFTPGMMAEFGWSRGEISTAAGLGLVGALAAPFIGRFADRLGVRAIIVTAMLLLGLAYLGLAIFSGILWQFQALIVCVALSVPGTSALVHGKLVASAFQRHRGIALGIATSGLSLTTIVIPPVLGLIIAAFGWRGGFVAMATLVVLIALPVVLVAIGSVSIASAQATQAATGDAQRAGYTGREARRTGTFWRLAIGVMVINLATVGFVSQLVLFGTDQGLSGPRAALLLASYGASQVTGRVVIGLLVDRYRPQRVAAITAIVSAVGFAALQIQQPGFELLMVAVFVAGIMNGAEHDLLPYFLTRIFGLRSFGEIYGTLLPLALLGSAVGTIAFGRLHDAMGNYQLALLIAFAGMIVAAISFGTLRAPALIPTASNAAPYPGT